MPLSGLLVLLAVRACAASVRGGVPGGERVGVRVAAPSYSTQDTHSAVERMMKEYDPALLWASRLLPLQTAQDAGALYAWCRRLDQIVDTPDSDDAKKRAALDEWKVRLDMLWKGAPTDALDAALSSTVSRHPTLHKAPFEDMLAGMRADAVAQRRICSFNPDLIEYGYQVAGTVGLMLLPLLGVTTELEQAKARIPAVALGTAIQIINIIRDVKADVALGRVYLPQDEMSRLGVREEDVMAGVCTPAYRRLIRRQARRAAVLLRSAEAGAHQLPHHSPAVALVIIEMYREYLLELEYRGYDNLSGGRISISAGRKIIATVRALKKHVQAL